MKVLNSKQHFEEAHKLLMKSIHEMHPLWKKMPPNKEEDANLQRFMLKASFDVDMVFGYYVGEAMVGLLTFLPISVYFKLQPPPCPNCPLFDHMRPLQQKLDTVMEATARKYNDFPTALINYWVVIDPDYQRHNIGPLASYYSIKYLYERGWTSFFGVTGNVVSLQLSYMFFGELVAAQKFTEKPFEGQGLQLIRFCHKQIFEYLKQEDMTVLAKL